MIVKNFNPCTLEKVELNIGSNEKLKKLFIECKNTLEDSLSHFLHFNLHKFTYGVSSSYYYSYEFKNDYLMIDLGDYEIEYDIKTLTSNIANNCKDCITVYYKNELNDKIHDLVVNSTMFKYFEVELYNEISKVFNNVARMCNDYEQNLREDDFEYENGIEWDTIQNIYDIYIKENF